MSHCCPEVQARPDETYSVATASAEQPLSPSQWIGPEKLMGAMLAMPGLILLLRRWIARFAGPDNALNHVS
jgi:hypothetical protein